VGHTCGDLSPSEAKKHDVESGLGPRASIRSRVLRTPPLRHSPLSASVRPMPFKMISTMTLTPARSGMQHVLDQLAARLPGVRITSYDGLTSGPADASTTLLITTPAAFAQILRAPRGLGLARAWVSGTIRVEGDLYSILQHEDALRDPWIYARIAMTLPELVRQLRYQDFASSGPTYAEYRRSRPGRHSVNSDLAEIDFHYGRELDFYRCLLGPSLTYSCGLFTSSDESLEDAQDNKHKTICKKLRIDADSVVLDIGCGWGTFLRYAAENYHCTGIGITASRAQYIATCRQSDPGHAENVNIRYGDYRQLLPIRGVNTAASVGVYEHIGRDGSRRFFRLIRSCLTPGSLYLNQSIVRRGGDRTKFRRNSFAQRYIFPNGEILPLSRQISDLERTGFHILSAELYGRSYAQTLRCWISNLEHNWDKCVQIEGEGRVRAWQIYLMGALTRFERRSIDLVQVLAQVK
jgi:cyclopropane-fatty-acyl-phospholipid synthase